MKVKTGLRAPTFPLRNDFERCQWCGAEPWKPCINYAGKPMLITHYQTGQHRSEATRLFGPLSVGGRAN